MFPKRLLLVSTVALLLLPAAALTTSAQAAEVDREWREEQRALEFSLLPNGFESESVRDSELGDDRFITKYDLDEARLRMNYISTETGNETVLTMDTTFLALVEFRDSTGDGRYGFGDEIIQRIPLSEMEGSIAAEPFVTGGRTATASYSFPTDPDGNNSSLPIGPEGTPLIPGGLEITFRVVPSTIVFDGSKVTPLDIMFQITVDRFPFDEQGTRLAFETRLVANQPIGSADWADRTLAARDGFFQSFFSWSRSAEVDGNERAVTATTLAHGATPTTTPEDGRSDLSIAFAYPRGEKIVHDPVVGVMRTQGIADEVVERLLTGDWLLYSLGLVATLVAVGVPAGLRLRQDR